MFDELGNKLDSVLGKFRQRAVITEPMLRDGLREVRRVLLEADVNYKVTRQFLERVQERALGEEVIKSVSPGQQIVKIVHDELASLLGEGPATLEWATSGPTVILVVGLQGSGKTTTAAKLAKRFAGEGRAPLLAACDLYRPAAVDQLATLGEQVGVPVHRGVSSEDPVAVAKAAVEVARRDGRTVLIVDTAGRLQIDEPMMDELRRLKADLAPQEILLVADAMTGQEAVNIAEGFDEALGLTGVILTKMDGDARGGAALSIRGVVGKPIKFVGVGETVDDLELTDPERMAGRILKMGDVVGLVGTGGAGPGRWSAGKASAADAQGTLYVGRLLDRDAAGSENGSGGAVVKDDSGCGPGDTGRGNRSEKDEACRGDHPLDDEG